MKVIRFKDPSYIWVPTAIIRNILVMDPVVNQLMIMRTSNFSLSEVRPTLTQNELTKD